ncbi:MAG: hypothetical protein FWG10_11860 [Eubacteriaceae bacterium]|nr:hypothetical protein [Eubacteriaceae bacterium]
MKPISIEIRKLIIQQRNIGKKLKEIAQVFAVSVSAVSSIFRVYGRTVSIEPKKRQQRGPSPYFNEEGLGRLRG